jgi:hypothetical protein
MHFKSHFLTIRYRPISYFRNNSNVRPPIAGLSESTAYSFRIASLAALRQAVPLAQSAMEDLKHGSLTEFEKIAILHLSAVGTKLFEIRRILNRSKSTVRSFQASYEKSDKLFPTRGRPPNEPIPWDLVGDLSATFMNLLRWPPRSPDLSPIEQYRIGSMSMPSITHPLLRA